MELERTNNGRLSKIEEVTKRRYTTISNDSDIIEKINFQKSKLLNNLSSISFSKPPMTINETLRWTILKNDQNRRIEEFKKELQNFYIENTKCVIYDGRKFFRPEPIRRLTQIHLAVIQEMAQYVICDTEDYQMALKQFIQLVR